MTELDLVREYLPKATLEMADYILWEATCYPIGSLSEVRKQLEQLAVAVKPAKRGWRRRLGHALARIDSDLTRALREAMRQD
jgi:hypothetical protein